MLPKSDFCFFPNFPKSQQIEILSRCFFLRSMDGIGMFLDRNVGSRDFSTVDVIDVFQQLLHHSKSTFKGNAWKKKCEGTRSYFSERSEIAKIQKWKKRFELLLVVVEMICRETTWCVASCHDVHIDDMSRSLLAWCNYRWTDSSSDGMIWS